MCVISLSDHMMDYTSVFLILIIGSCTHSTGDSLFYSCLYLIVHVNLIVFLVCSCWRSREKWANYSNLRGTPPCCWVNSFCLAVLDPFYWDSKAFFVFSVCTCRLILTCRSSAHRWPAYPHHHQVKPAWPSIILHHLRRNERLLTLLKLLCVSLLITTPALFSSVHEITPADISTVYIMGVPLSHRSVCWGI